MPPQGSNLAGSLGKETARRTRIYIAAAAAVVGIYLLLASTSMNWPNARFDEFTDLVIAKRLAHSPLSGHPWDGSQARLPMYVTAMAIQVMEIGRGAVSPLDALTTSRWISVAATALAAVGTFVLGWVLFHPLAGLFAAALFALSPYVLNHGSSALTEGDAFTPLMVVVTLLAARYFDVRRTTVGIFALAMTLAMAIGSKFYLVVLAPAIMVYQLFSYRLGLTPEAAQGASSGPAGRLSRSRRMYLLVCWLTVSSTLGAVAISLTRPSGPLTQATASTLTVSLWVGSLIGLLVSLLLAVRAGRAKSSTVDPERWPLGWSWFAILSLACSASLSLLPAHVFNPDILRTLLDRGATLDGAGQPFAVLPEGSKLYVGILLLKLGLPLGLASAGAILWGFTEARRSQPMLLLMSTLLCYSLLLAALPLYQSFYLMSIYPLLTLVLAAMLTAGLRHRPGARVRRLTAAYLAAGVLYLAIGISEAYPTFGLYGAKVAPNKWMGTGSRGYRSLVNVTSEGSIDAIDWLRSQADSGSVVLSYLLDRHLIRHLDEQNPFPFELVSSWDLPRTAVGPARYLGVDYVMFGAVGDPLNPGPALDADFRAAFGTEAAFEVIRGRGEYRMPVIQIFRSRTAN